MSSLDELEDPWGQLVGLDRQEGDLVPLVGDQFSIGRGKNADLEIADNRFVSTFHCVLVRGDGGWVSLRDTSSNGTLVNGTKLDKNTSVKLASHDVIKIVNRKDKPEYNVAFKFIYSIPPTEELDSTLSYEDLDNDISQQTVDYDPLEIAAETVDYDPSDIPTETVDYDPSDIPTETVDYDPSDIAAEIVDEEPKTLAGKKHELESCDNSVPESKKAATEEAAKNDSKNSISPEKNEEETKPPLKKDDSISDTLICVICQEILHDCVSLQPCMHSYCAGCYSGWMDSSNKCPDCRNRVERVSKNHIVNNLVEAYLRTNPHKKRPEEDLKELDAKNKITRDMLYPKKRGHYYDGVDYSDDDGMSSSTDSEEDIPPPHFITPLPLLGMSSGLTPAPFGFHHHHPPSATFGLGATPAPFTLCRQCPSYTPPTHTTPSHPTPPPFTCTTTTNHVLCLCCLQPMPDRRNDSDMSIPPQKCDICGQAYCHMYWGCRRPGCTGCLNLFKDMDFLDRILEGVLNNGNAYESKVLKEYMEGKSLSIKDVLTSCCAKLESGEYTCSDSRTSRMSSSTRTCYKCGLKNFKDLLYLYRRDIPASELPVAVTSRPNCYWGKNCRTQVNKTHHSERYNHICDQTRH